jgi:hypothetical protein
MLHGLSKGLCPKVSLSTGTIHTIKKSCQINQFVSGIHEIKIQDLVSGQMTHDGAHSIAERVETKNQNHSSTERCVVSRTWQLNKRRS